MGLSLGGGAGLPVPGAPATGQVFNLLDSLGDSAAPPVVGRVDRNLYFVL